MPDRSRKHPDRSRDPSRLVGQDALKAAINAPRTPAQKAAAAKWFRQNMGPVEEDVMREADAAHRRTSGPEDPDNFDPVYDEYGQY